jgi:hypothetical protein
MDAVNVPERYFPYMNCEGQYIDTLPHTKDKIICGCGSETIFTKRTLKYHFERNIHREWLLLLNQEKHNHLKQLDEYKSLYLSQKKLIQQQQEKIIMNETLILQLQTKIMNHETNLYDTLYNLD